MEEDVRKETSLHMKAMARNNITEWLSGVCVCVCFWSVEEDIRKATSQHMKAMSILGPERSKFPSKKRSR